MCSLPLYIFLIKDSNLDFFMSNILSFLYIANHFLLYQICFLLFYPFYFFVCIDQKVLGVFLPFAFLLHTFPYKRLQNNDGILMEEYVFTLFSCIN